MNEREREVVRMFDSILAHKSGSGSQTVKPQTDNVRSGMYAFHSIAEECVVQSQ